MAGLQRLRADHAPAVLAFERDNRGYFAAAITDRGDGYFEHFAERHRSELAEQGAGVAAHHLLVDDDGSILGRFNLRDIGGGTATVGYRVAATAAGRGVATAAVRELCRLAVADHGLRTLTAATSLDNVASRKVLTNAGFHLIGPADPADVGGHAGLAYRRALPAAMP